MAGAGFLYVKRTDYRTFLNNLDWDILTQCDVEGILLLLLYYLILLKCYSQLEKKKADILWITVEIFSKFPGFKA